MKIADLLPLFGLEVVNAFRFYAVNADFTGDISNHANADMYAAAAEGVRYVATKGTLPETIATEIKE